MLRNRKANSFLGGHADAAVEEDVQVRGELPDDRDDRDAQEPSAPRGSKGAKGGGKYGTDGGKGAKGGGKGTRTRWESSAPKARLSSLSRVSARTLSSRR